MTTIAYHAAFGFAADRRQHINGTIVEDVDKLHVINDRFAAAFCGPTIAARELLTHVAGSLTSGWMTIDPVASAVDVIGSALPFLSRLRERFKDAPEWWDEAEVIVADKQSKHRLLSFSGRFATIDVMDLHPNQPFAAFGHGRDWALASLRDGSAPVAAVFEAAQNSAFTGGPVDQAYWGDF